MECGCCTFCRSVVAYDAIVPRSTAPPCLHPNQRFGQTEPNSDRPSEAINACKDGEKWALALLLLSEAPQPASGATHTKRMPGSVSLNCRNAPGLLCDPSSRSISGLKKLGTKHLRESIVMAFTLEGTPYVLNAAQSADQVLHGGLQADVITFNAVTRLHVCLRESGSSAA